MSVKKVLKDAKSVKKGQKVTKSAKKFQKLPKRANKSVSPGFLPIFKTSSLPKHKS